MRDASLVDAVTASMGEVARTVILPRYNQLAQSDIRSKTHPADLVTIADEESERALEATLKRLLPGSAVIGEEAVAADPSRLDALTHGDPLWIIDPIDGTSNFVNGVPAFAVVIALLRGSEVVMGWIHDPLTGRTLWAERGAGAWRRPAQTDPVRNDARITLPEVPRDLGALTAAIYHRDLAAIKGKFARIIRQGSAAHDYWALAEGRLDVLAYRRLKPWDHAAGLLIHAEAGGYNRLLTGMPYQSRDSTQSGLLCAPSAEIWQSIKDLAADQQTSLEVR